MLSQRWVMFRRNITSATADSKQCAAGNQTPNRSATQIAGSTQGLVGADATADENPSAKGRPPCS
ncbi:MAG: hypothetical protein LBI18_06495 [Planctomycetaceae bacterium]|jgi:hypothetical protein|nr:hypothetical protein [Planctomycetaceae bacterium]